jgi:hypothetical protein
MLISSPISLRVTLLGAILLAQLDLRGDWSLSKFYKLSLRAIRMYSTALNADGMVVLFSRRWLLRVELMEEYSFLD